MDKNSDFLDLGDQEFPDKSSLIKYIDEQYRFGQLSRSFNIIASINDLDEPEEFISRLETEFNILNRSGNLFRIHDTYESDPVYSYVYFDENTPLFLTNANLTDEIPDTITRFLKTNQGIGRLMLSKREIDQNRQQLMKEHENLMVPYFSATRSMDEPISAQQRPKTRRTIQYDGRDGLQTFREMRYNYGVLPRIMTFERPGKFKFKIKADGTFVHVDGGLETLWQCLKREIDRIEDVVESANTGSYGPAESKFLEGDERFSVSKPWAVEVSGGIDQEHVETLPEQLSDDFWEFGVSDYFAEPELESFEAEVIDNTTRERTTLKSKGDDIRIFPRELTDVDQSVRLYNFISDHFDTDCKPKKVA